LHARYLSFAFDTEVAMRRFPSALIIALSGCILGSLAGTRAHGENKIGLTSFEQAVAAPPQLSATGGVSSAAAMPRTMPRFAARSVVSPTTFNFPRRPAIQPQGSRSTRRMSKPFEHVDRDPTISPYLNLDRDDDEQQIVPNYFTFVRPQLEQLQTNRMQQREIQQLRGQVQGMTMSGIAPQSATYRAPGTGVSARFMDTAQFYGGGR
jgi:hypothetical protein